MNNAQTKCLRPERCADARRVVSSTLYLKSCKRLAAQKKRSEYMHALGDRWWGNLKYNCWFGHQLLADMVYKQTKYVFLLPFLAVVILEFENPSS